MTGSLDGREVSETERQFLMNWKVMRVARRKQQKADALTEQTGSMPMAYSKYQKTQQFTSSSKAQLPKAALPLTLLALPARQLPRRRKRAMQYQHTEHQPEYRTMLLPVYSVAEVSKDISGGLRLPEIVPDQLPSLVAQKPPAIQDSLPMIQHQPLVSSISRRPVHVAGGFHNRFM